ncbi:hypothetical protein F4555_001724 [Mobiluncus mulieris]|nr:hypothetical protein [Mobiluncus mulieris]MBB5846928.1 hypothetical protein [Mobiluncus mulieris]
MNPPPLPHCELESREAFRASLALYNFDVAVFVEAHALKHGLDEAEIEYAWNHLVATKLRFDGSMPPRWIGLGSLPDGRMVQMVASESGFGDWYVFHAMTPPTKTFLRELGIDARKRK